MGVRRTNAGRLLAACTALHGRPEWLVELVEDGVQEIPSGKSLASCEGLPPL